MRQLNERPFDYGEVPGDKKGFMQATRRPGAKGGQITDDKRYALAKYLARTDGPQPRKAEVKAKWAAGNPDTDPEPFQHKDPVKRKEEHDRLNPIFDMIQSKDKETQRKGYESIELKRDYEAAKKMDKLQDEEEETIDDLRARGAAIEDEEELRKIRHREKMAKKKAEANEEFVGYFGELYDFLME